MALIWLIRFFKKEDNPGIREFLFLHIQQNRLHHLLDVCLLEAYNLHEYGHQVQVAVVADISDWPDFVLLSSFFGIRKAKAIGRSF